MFSEADDLSTWTRMAERGLFAFDADIYGGPYRLIAAPVTPLKFHELPLCWRRWHGAFASLT